MTNIKNWISLVIVFLSSFITALFLVSSSLLNLNHVKELGNDLQYNLISISATIGGFLFTGVSILISALDNERIERLWNHAYLDNVYRAAFVGIGSSILTIIAALAMLLLVLEENIHELIIKVEIITVLIGLVFFTWCVLDLVFIVSTMKEHSKTTLK